MIEAHGATTTASEAFDAPLSPSALELALRTAQPLQVECVASTGSTNADLLARARECAPARPIVRAALVQTSGRGRRGRPWHAAAGRSLLFSVAVPWSRGLADAPAVTLCAGVAVAEVLHGRAIAARLKWPNDVLLGGRKLAGILTEAVVDADGAACLVIGIGINLVLDAAQRVLIGQPAAALAECVAPSQLAREREAWIGSLALGVLDALRQYDRDGFAPFRPRFDALFAYAGQRVALMQDGSPSQVGVARGVDAFGRLLLERDGRISAVIGGELSLRAERR